jgi:alpha-mannosidase
MVSRHPELTRRRIAQAAGRLRSLVHPELVAPDELLVSERAGRISPAEARGLAYRPARIGEPFGPQWATYWFKLAATLPPAWEGQPVELVWDSRSEATVWRDGEPLQALSSSSRGQRVTAPVEPREGRIELMVEMACNELMGLPDPFKGVPLHRTGRTWEEPVDDRSLHAAPPPARLVRAGLARVDHEAWDMLWDLEVLRALEAEPDLEPAWGGHLLAELNRFANAWIPAERDTWPQARAILAALLSRRNAGLVHRVTAVGHAHLDTAWLWPLAESRRKVVRSFANQLALMERYPEHRFVASSAQHYAWLEEDAPGLYARVRERVEEGRWEVVGGSWVEPDLNLPSGESLVRQLLYGQRELEQRFGRRCREAWVPDTFGYNGQLPQILRGAGIDRFLTQKLSWNQFTKPPHHSFRWEGIDGSWVLVHMPPADTYNAELTVPELRASAARFRDHDRSGTSLLAFGYGDGGGGPTPEMLERARRLGDLQGVPRVRLGTSDGFFSALEEELGAEPPVVTGELYFEYHRGTYTSQAATKRGNRAGERLLHEAEAAAAIAHRLGRAEYPAEELRALWRTLLLNQFHDILPGSSIREVYEDAARDHAAVAEEAARLRDAAIAALDDGNEPVPLNLTPFHREEVVERDGRLCLVDAQPYGFGGEVQAEGRVRVDGLVMENAHLRAEFDERGRLVSLLHGREALAGPANVFELSEDRPTTYDAWELEPYADETRRALQGAHAHRVVTDDPLRAEIEFEHRIGDASTLRQTVRLDAHSSRLEFRATIDWRERHRILRVAFPLAVRAANATYEMQFGVAERPTHVNTQADLARYEVPAHGFADLSEHRFGVALLTPDTHGVAIRGGTARLSLLRAPTDPDPEADQGVHEIAYALMPHGGGWREAWVVAEARSFATPLRWGTGARVGARVSSDDLVLDTVKRAEDSDDLILRLYEAHGARGTARIRLGVPFSGAHRCDLLEGESRGELPVDGDEIEVAYRPFELITVAVRP